MKTKFVQKVTLSILLILNIVLAGYVLSNHILKSGSNKIVPVSLLTENEIIKNRVNTLLGQKQNKQIAIALLTTASTSCSTGKIVKIFKEAAEKSQNSKFILLLPNQFSQQDIENFKSNLKVNFEVEKADEELSSFWIPLATEYEAKGIVILSDDGRLTAFQDTKEIERRLATFK